MQYTYNYYLICTMDLASNKAIKFGSSISNVYTLSIYALLLLELSQLVTLLVFTYSVHVYMRTHNTYTWYILYIFFLMSLNHFRHHLMTMATSRNYLTIKRSRRRRRKKCKNSNIFFFHFISVSLNVKFTFCAFRSNNDDVDLFIWRFYIV